MPLMKCPECRGKISDQCGTCPHCGFPIGSAAINENNAKPQIIKPFHKKVWVWIVASLLVVSLTTGVIFFFNQDTKPKLDKKGNPIFVELTNEVYTNAKDYLGYYVNIKGQVFQVVGDSGETKQIQVWLDPENCEQNLMIYYKSDAELKEGDYVICTGYIDSIHKYTNAYGTKLQTPLVYSTDLKQSSYVEVMAPAKETIVPQNLIIEQLGYSVTINKIEFSDKETRVYVTVTNNGSALLYIGDIVIVQDGKQYNSTTNYAANYDELTCEIVKGASSSGIIVFEYISTNDFELNFDVHSDNFDEELNEYAFIIGKDFSTNDIKEYRAVNIVKTFKETKQGKIATFYDFVDYLFATNLSDEEISYILDYVEANSVQTGIFLGAAMYDYDKIELFCQMGYSRDAIIEYYLDLFSQAEAECLVDACLAGRKLTYQYVDGELKLVEH